MKNKIKMVKGKKHENGYFLKGEKEVGEVLAWSLIAIACVLMVIAFVIIY